MTDSERRESTDESVNVRRQWNDYRDVAVPFSAVEGPHWDRASGGVAALAPQPFLHAYIWCDALGGAEFGHSCRHGPPPHRIKVCIIKRTNDPHIFRKLVEQAGPKPGKKR